MCELPLLAAPMPLAAPHRRDAHSATTTVLFDAAIKLADGGTIALALATMLALAYLAILECLLVLHRVRRVR